MSNPQPRSWDYNNHIESKLKINYEAHVNFMINQTNQPSMIWF